jgi:uncharacterized protein (TIGR03435 family)
MMTSHRFLPGLLGIALVASAADPAFDVAAVKPATPGVREGLTIQPGGRLSANGFSLKTLIIMANHIAQFQISGADGWMADDRWSIEAKAEDVTEIPAWSVPYPPEIMALRLRTLLEDRFGLKLHREKREMKAYKLTMGKKGSKLISGDESAHGRMSAGPGEIRASAVSMGQFAMYLNKIMDLPVIDKTGLEEFYKVDLKFAPESSRPLSVPTAADGSAAPSVSNAPSIFDAIEEQLGLELKLAREQVEFLVVDSARRPSAN